MYSVLKEFGDTCAHVSFENIPLLGFVIVVIMFDNCTKQKTPHARQRVIKYLYIINQI